MAVSAVAGALDAESRRWLEGLRADGPRRDRCIHELQARMLRVARAEIGRRRGMLSGASGPELDDLAHQAADDAVVAILAKLDTFRGASRFTTWAYKFAIHQVSLKTRHHLWSGPRTQLGEAAWERLEHQAPDSPQQQAERRGQLRALRHAVEDLTHHQREVFVAVALNETPVDLVAERLGSTRGAIYKTLFDARVKLRASLAATGYPIGTP